MGQKVVVITGCSAGGIGFALAQACARRGCLVYATARRPEAMTGLEACGCKLVQLDVQWSQDRIQEVRGVEGLKCGGERVRLQGASDGAVVGVVSAGLGQRPPAVGPSAACRLGDVLPGHLAHRPSTAS